MKLVAAMEKQNWKTIFFQSGTECQGFVATTTIKFLNDVEINGGTLRRTIKILTKVVENSSRWLWSMKKRITKYTYD